MKKLSLLIIALFSMFVSCENSTTETNTEVQVELTKKIMSYNHSISAFKIGNDVFTTREAEDAFNSKTPLNLCRYTIVGNTLTVVYTNPFMAKEVSMSYDLKTYNSATVELVENSDSKHKAEIIK